MKFYVEYNKEIKSPNSMIFSETERIIIICIWKKRNRETPHNNW